MSPRNNPDRHRVDGPGGLFLGFFYLLRQQGIPVGPNEWLAFVEAMDKGLVAADLKRFYAIARATLVKHERYYDTFDQCFAHYFDGAEAPVALAKAIDDWLSNPKPVPHLSDEMLAQMQRLDFDELMRQFEERLKEQTERHDGGNRWVGTGGTSPFGNNGVNPMGIRVGGSSGGRSAVQVAASRRYYNYRTDLVLDTRQISMALRRLRRLGRDGQATEIDVDGTIDVTARNAGDLEIALIPPRENRLKVLLLMDVGGSMDPYSLLVSRLFSAAHAATHFKEFNAFYFHNCPYDGVYKDARMNEGMGTLDLMRWLPKDTRVVYVGDACMHPYELTARYGALDYGQQNENTGLEWLLRLDRHFEKSIWLNPMSRRYWAHPTIRMIGEVFPMFDLTLDGLEEAVKTLQ
ncbi:MAG: vWA domain-containing protein [Bradymonadia bacterium]